ncbi:MAG: ABC transporter ATP-binding protein [Christensenella sp.]|uniref:ABC transporter ATP-binding protein n=1 Tax=Christensenella sp. TaxID=1935934 RepID=UPI002B21A56C|nr:ABC transporter ATP-binding protein [Christensenella sp.]MEA5004748.1 ABC transporter ATP-binding protein [Christensenella sp.]
MNEKLAVENLSKIFGTNQVLHGIDFTVHEGEFLSVLGPSGCGKTTLLRMLIGLEQPTEGKIYKDGKDITNSIPSARGMGIVFQNYALFENMTVLGNVEYALKRHPSLKDKAHETAERLIEQVGLAEHKEKRPGKLSGGQQQRVAIARTLALNPDIILFDEPMSALDVDTRLSLRAELKSIQKKFGSTMIYITHDQEEAFAMSDRIMVLNEGKIQQIDTPRNIIDRPANEYVERFVIHNIQLKIDSLIQFARAKA